MAFTPDCVCFDVIAERAIGESIFERGSFRVTHDLYDASENPRWIEHPRGGREVDVVALNVGPVINPLIEKPHYRSFHLPPNECPSTDFSPQVGDDAFVIGFPERIDGGAGLPIFKRASIASEPDVDLDHQPKLLIDTATRHGMSGSPVIVAQQYPLAKVYRFLGIYGARIGDDTMGVQLGVVWKASVITDILCDGVPGRTPFDRGVGG
jgi:hypothetical protein